MKKGDIVLLPFPFSELTEVKVRPAIVIGFTADKYKDVIVCAISSVIPKKINDNEIIITSNSRNGLRVDSIIKADRIVTIKKESVIAKIGSLNKDQSSALKNKLKEILK